MNEANNDSPVRLGLVADAADAERFATAVRACPGLDLLAQTGMPQADAVADTPWFDDTRVFFAQTGIEAVVLATSTRDCVEFAETAAARGLHVWRLPPLGRSFAEATQTIRLAAAGTTHYRVASWWDHVADPIRGALQADEDFQPVFSEVIVSAPSPGMHSWRASRALSAGGALALDGYSMLEALVAVRGLPETVTAATAGFRRRAAEPPHETEDVAAAIFRYEGRGVATIRASWDLLPYEAATRHHGHTMTIAFSDREISTFTPNGSPRERHRLPDGSLTAEMARFASMIRRENTGEGVSHAVERHVAVAALLEAVYLAAQTGQPEIPRKFYQVQGWPEPVAYP